MAVIEALTRQVYVETPPPSNMVCERSAQERSDHTRYSVCSCNKACIYGSLFEWHSVGTDDLRSRKDTTSAEPSNRSSNYQCNGVGGHSANERAYLEEGECSQKNPFDTELAVQFAK